MKNNFIGIGLIIGTFFSVNVFAADSCSVSEDNLIQAINTLQIEEKKHSNPLLDYIQKYDVNVGRVHPKPARTFLPGENLDFPKMNPLFMPLVFNNIHREFKVSLQDLQEKMKSPCSLSSKVLDSLRVVYCAKNYVEGFTRSIMIDAESRYIGIIKYDKKALPQSEEIVYPLKSRRQASFLKPLIYDLNKEADTKYLPKSEYKPWTTNCNVKLQFSQTYNSPNWSNGGESNMSGLSTIYLQANYADLKKIQFDNYLEAKIGLNTASSDSLRNINVSTDQLKIVSKLGVNMYNNLYYSLSGEFTTQFLKNYSTNTTTLQASFMSPAKLFIGLGIDYKKTDKKNKYNLSVLLTPLTCKMSYLYDNVNMSPSSYGIKDGKHFGQELGSKISTTLTWKISDNIQWKSVFYYYSDFTYVDSDWENTFDFTTNNYFTTSFYIHLKMDDRLERESNESLVQMQELFSFGLLYRW
jgi:hypothetical protein